MSNRQPIRILRNWTIIAALVALGLGAGAAYALTKTPHYESSTQLYASVRADGAATDELVQGTTLTRQMVTSYVDVVGTALVLDPVIEEMRLTETVAALATRVTASTPPDTVLLNIAVTDEDPVMASQITDLIAANLVEVVQNQLERPDVQSGMSAVQLTVTNPAVVATTPSSPDVPLHIVIGGLIGLVAGIVLAVLRTVLDSCVRTLRDVERLSERPVLGSIVRDADAKNNPLLVQADPSSARAESYRTLRTNLQSAVDDVTCRTIVVTSAEPCDDKSLTAVNLAIALAETGARVALVDADLRQPRIAEHMGITDGIGLTSVLTEQTAITDALQKWGKNNLYVLPSGPLPQNPSELLDSGSLERVFTPLEEYFDFVVVDAPPLLSVTDAAVLGRKARGVVLVAAADTTTKPDLSDAIHSLETAGVELLGFVVTGVSGKRTIGYGGASSARRMQPTSTDQPVSLVPQGEASGPRRRGNAVTTD